MFSGITISYFIISHHFIVWKIAQSEVVTGTTIFVLNKTRQTATGVYITGTLKSICQHYRKVLRKTFLTDAFQMHCIQKPKKIL